MNDVYVTPTQKRSHIIPDVPVSALRVRRNQETDRGTRLSVLYHALLQCGRQITLVSLLIQCAILRSAKSESEVIAFIAQNLGVETSSLVFPPFICCTCFDILRDSLYS